jgi:hypothetical protein
MGLPGLSFLFFPFEDAHPSPINSNTAKRNTMIDLDLKVVSFSPNLRVPAVVYLFTDLQVTHALRKGKKKKTNAICQSCNSAAAVELFPIYHTFI